MALNIEMCRIVVDVRDGKANVQVSVADATDPSLKKSAALKPTLSPQLLASIKTEVNAALTAASLPTVP
jgi:hypothetical protein